MSPFSRSIRHGVVAGVAVLVLAGSAVGIAAAQTQPTTTPAGQQAQNGYQAFVDALAKRLNVTPTNLQTAISQARTDVGLPAGNEFPGRGFGERGPGFRGLDPTVAAQAIGISADQLRTELPGKSLALVAQAHNTSAADVATALKNAAHARIDQSASARGLSADQVTQQKTRVDQRIDQFVNQVLPQGGPNGRGFGDRGPGFGERGPGFRGLDPTVAAQAIGISADQLRTELPGKSLAQVAQAHNTSAADVATALKNAARARIDQSASARGLSADQVTQQKTQVDQRIDQLVNEVLPRPGQGGAPRGGFDRGFDGDFDGGFDRGA